MTSTNLGSMIVCTNPCVRLHVGKRYIWMDYHAYTGASFFKDSAMTKVYEPTGVKDPIWKAMQSWLHKKKAQK